MRRQKIDASYIQALSRLEPVDYSSTPALADVYKRLDAGRNAFPEILGETSYVTTPVDRDGIYVALKHFGLI